MYKGEITAKLIVAESLLKSAMRAVKEAQVEVDPKTPKAGRPASE